MNTVKAEKDHSKAYFWLVITVILGSMALYSYALHLQAAEIKAKFEQEKQAMAHIAEALYLKDALEDCSHRSTNQELKLDIFNMLLAHTIEQNVPHETLRKQLEICKKTL